METEKIKKIILDYCVWLYRQHQFFDESDLPEMVERISGELLKSTDLFSVEVYRLVRCLSALAQESEAVFKYLEKIEPYEAHEMSPDTPTPDGYWIALENAKKILSANAKLNRRSDDGTNYQ